MSDKTYSEVCGKPAFDWWKALNNPQDYDHAELRAKAGNWVTCACGNQCAILPRYPKDSIFIGEPIDDELNDLGIEFSKQVDADRWEMAKDTLTKIEKRSAILIAEELAKRNAPAYAESAQE